MSGLTNKEHRVNYQNAWDHLSGLYQGFMAQLRMMNRPQEQKVQIRQAWLCQLCTNEAATIVAMGEAYRALNLEEYENGLDR